MALTKVRGDGVQGMSLLSTSTALTLDANGHVTKPLQSAFLVTPSARQSDIANAATIAFGTETFDQNGDFSSNTFTAPVTGRYQFNVNMRVDNLSVTGAWNRIELVTSNRTYITTMIDAAKAFSESPGEFAMHGIILADMDANDTAHLTWNQSVCSQVI